MIATHPRLTPRQTEVLYRYVVEALTWEEVAYVMRLSERTVRRVKEDALVALGAPSMPIAVRDFTQWLVEAGVYGTPRTRRHRRPRAEGQLEILV